MVPFFFNCNCGTATCACGATSFTNTGCYWANAGPGFSDSTPILNLGEPLKVGLRYAAQWLEEFRSLWSMHVAPMVEVALPVLRIRRARSLHDMAQRRRQKRRAFVQRIAA